LTTQKEEFFVFFEEAEFGGLACLILSFISMNLASMNIQFRPCRFKTFRSLLYKTFRRADFSSELH